MAPDYNRGGADETSEVPKSVAISQLKPCLNAGEAELKLGSFMMG